MLSHSLSCYLTSAPSSCPQGIQAWVLALSNAACSSPFCPYMLVADAGVLDTFPLGVAFRHVICGFCLFFLAVRLHSEIWKHPPDPPVRGFPGVWKLPLLGLPSRDRSPSLALLSLFLSFIFCPTYFWRWWVAFLGAWCPLLVIRSCFVEFAQHSNDLSMNLLGRKWSPCPIPPPSSVLLLFSRVFLFATPQTATHQAPLSSTLYWSLLRYMSIESVMLSNHLILYHPLLLLPSILPSIRVFPNEPTRHIRWPKYWSFSIIPSNEYSGLIPLGLIGWSPCSWGILKSLLQHHNLKILILQLSLLYDPILTSVHDC